MKGKKPIVSCVIPTLNSAKTIRKCLDSVMRLDYPKDILEILIIDNGSNDPTIDIVSKYPAKITVEPTKGRGCTYDRGFRKAKGKYVAYLDSDAIVPSAWLKTALQIIGQNSSVAAVYFKSLAPPNSSYFQKCVDTLLSKSWGGANGSVYKKKALENVNGFNKSLPYLQEDELKIKLLKRSYEVKVAEEPVIYHYPRENLVSYFAQCIEAGIGSVKLYLIIRQPHMILSWFLRAAIAVFPLLAVVSFILSSTISYILVLGITIGGLLYSVHLWRSTDSTYQRVRYILPATILMWISSLGNLVGYVVGLISKR